MKLVNNFDKANEKIKKSIDESLDKIGLLITAESQVRSPVDTGRLRASMTHEVSGLEVFIGTNVEYAPDVELGTSKQRAQPFLRDSFAASSSKVKSIIKKTLEDNI